MGLFTSSACSLFGVSTTEEPTYKVFKSSGPMEIRRYDSYIVAQTSVKGDMEEASNTGFRRLAAYIFAKNRDGEKLAMTAPVTQKETNEKIEMTAPVLQKKQGSDYIISFIMPKKYTLATLPKPKDESITFKEIPARTVATYQYSWFRSEEKNKKYVKKLKDWVQSFEEFTVKSTYSSAGYNPPWTIPFLRRNEVIIELGEDK